MPPLNGRAPCLFWHASYILIVYRIYTYRRLTHYIIEAVIRRQQIFRMSQAPTKIHLPSLPKPSASRPQSEERFVTSRRTERKTDPQLYFLQCPELSSFSLVFDCAFPESDEPLVTECE